MFIKFSNIQILNKFFIYIKYIKKYNKKIHQIKIYKNKKYR